MNRFLTRQERQFTLGYLQEQYEGMRQGKVPEGPAFKWMAENGLAHREFQPFTLALTEELGKGSPVPPPEEEYSAPWASIEEFRRRAAELDQAVHGLQRQARVEDNACPSSIEERSLPEDEHDGAPGVAIHHLTEQERLFITGYQDEMTADEEGPATVGWLVKHNLSHADMHPFTMQLTRELDAEGLPYPPRPAEYPIPWASLEEFRARREMLREIHSKSVQENATRHAPRTT